MNPRFYTFWAINSALDQGRLRRQMDQFRAAGFDGVVWHPRFYPNDPPYLGEHYLQEVSDAILYAKAIGLAFWIYDEDGWPSGTVGGQLLKQFPDDAQRWAELVDERPERCLAEFDHDGRKWFLSERIGAGVDYFNPELARHFIALTHERYRTGLAPEAWAHIGAIFCDEPEFGLGHAYASLSKHGAIPWTPKLPEIFQVKHGEDLLSLLPQLFFSNKKSGETRVRFWELLTDLFNDSFTAPINQWCAQHGKVFTAHLKGEEHPLFQVPTNGSCHPFFHNVALPGIDALERYPGNNYYPRQVSSAARQFGNGRCMVEAFGGAGWGATPEDLERYLLWLGSHGLTDFVLHLSQYRLDSAAIADWPPSQPLHLTWREVYPEVIRRVRAELQRNPRPLADTLVVAPNRRIMSCYDPAELLQTNIHNAKTYPDTSAGQINRRFMDTIARLHQVGRAFDVVDERTLEQFGQFQDSILSLGKCHYGQVLLGEDAQINDSIGSQLHPFTAKADDLVSRGAVAQEFRDSASVSIPVEWKLQRHPVNGLLLESVLSADGWFTAEFESSTALPPADLEIVFADDIAALALNGLPLSAQLTDEGSRSTIQTSIVQARNTLRFQTLGTVAHPFVWINGVFRVGCSGEYTAGPRDTLKTEGRFQLQTPREMIATNLIADGFPFLRHSLTAFATVKLPGAVSRLRLNGFEADAVRLTVDDCDYGWAWRASGEICFAGKFSAGSHRLKIEIVPNTFNYFGPHHYYQGDWFVVSPDQMKGLRNFADPPDAPDHTHVNAWHFRRLQLPDSISV